MLVFAAAVGTITGTSHLDSKRDERSVVSKIAVDAFVRVRAPLQRDWSDRAHFHSLRSSRFEVNGHTFDADLTLYARFAPPVIELEKFVTVEGFLRRDDNGRYSMSVKSARLLSYEGRISAIAPATWNRLMANRLRRHSRTHPRETAMIEALVLGRGERLSDATRDEFKRGGTYHLLVFSGLQISIAAAAIAMLLRWTGAPRGSDLSLLAFALLAPLFIGASASVARASTGIALYASSRILRRPTSFENLWCVAAMVRLIIAPADLTDPGFHLTYAGAGALLFIGKPLSRTRLRWMAYAVAAEIAIAPITLFHFHQYALGGSLATIAMTPLVLVMLVVGILFCATELTPLLGLIGLLNQLCTRLNVAASPASGFFTAPLLWAMVLGCGASLLAVAVLRGRMRTIAVITALTIPTASAFVVARGQRSTTHPTVTFFDVGQGDAILISTESHHVLVDGGGRADDARFGESVLLPLLADRGVGRLDVVVLTHAHPDHCGGLESVLRRMRVGELWISPRRFRGECAHRMLDAAARADVPIRLVRDRLDARLGSLTLHAVTNGPYRRAPDNNSSIVIRAQWPQRSVLLTGDIERDAEARLDFERADIMKVPHHGSRTSTSRYLLDAVQPRLAVISCGRRNVFGHPHPDVLRALEMRGIRTWRTDVSGTITAHLTPNGVRVVPEIDTTR